MKGAPNFIAWPDAVSGLWKIDFLRWLQQQTEIRYFVETGTCEGITPMYLHDYFIDLYTIELHEGLYESSRKRLSEFKNVHQYLGDSRLILPYILLDCIPTNEPVLLWLDAHGSGPHTAGNGDDPLAEELKIITSLCPQALIVVDDMKDATLHQELDPPGWHREFRTGEILMHKEGTYSIQPFEE
jgi:hypothetical protein